MNQGIGDSIDDIITLLSKHYQPQKLQIPPKAPNGTNYNLHLNTRPMLNKDVQSADKNAKRKAYSVNSRQAETGKRSVSIKTDGPSIRYLTFKSFSGRLVDNQKDNGYYYKFNGAPIKLIKGTFDENGFIETQDKNWTFYWSSGSIKTEIYQGLLPYQKISHFPKSHEITRKDLMHRNISKMQINHGHINFNFIPKTFILPAEMSYFLEEHEKIRNSQPMYICKPHASSQGRGIFITDKVQDILNRQNINMSYVVSHYIDNPLLINNLKFDLRIYVAITSINPLRIYVYEDGLARFATETYSLDSIKGNKFGHLTNYSVNKESPNFIPNSDPSMDHIGSKWSLLSLREYLKLNKINDAQIFERIDDLIVKTIISVESTIFQSCEMHVPYRSNCFSLFGFDVLIDQSLKAWLLEVNLSPSLNIDAPIDLKIKGDMISDLFTMLGIVPMDQRFSNDNQYLRNQKNTTETKSRNQQDIEKYVIWESEEELKRCRSWRKVFPTECSFRYAKYFENERPLNVALRNHYRS